MLFKKNRPQVAMHHLPSSLFAMADRGGICFKYHHPWCTEHIQSAGSCWKHLLIRLIVDNADGTIFIS